MSMEKNYSGSYLTKIKWGNFGKCLTFYFNRNNYIFGLKFCFINTEFCVITGIDFKQKIINLDGVPIRLQIW